MAAVSASSSSSARWYWASASSAASEAPAPIATITPTPTPTAPAEIPDDCREMLSDDVLAQLEGVPLNHTAFGPSGVMPDGSLKCIWADPAADTTGLTTTISRMARGPALELLNEYAAEHDFECHTP